MYRVFAIIFWLTPLTARGEPTGAWVEVCATLKPQPLEMAIDMLSADLQAIPQVASVESQVNVALQALKHLSPLRLDLYQQTFARFMTNINLRPAPFPVPTEKTAVPALPGSGCVATKAVDRQANGPGLEVVKPLWDQLGILEKSTLILHMVVEDELLGYRHPAVEVSARAMAAHLVSTRLADLPVELFFEQLRNWRFFKTDWQGYWIQLFNADNACAGEGVHWEEPLAAVFRSDDSLLYGQLLCGSTRTFSGYEMSVSGQASFFSKDGIRSFWLDSGVALQEPFIYAKHQVAPGPFVLTENGRLARLVTGAREWWQVKSNYRWLDAQLPITFDLSGVLSDNISGFVRQPTPLPRQKHKTTLSSSVVCRDARDKILSADLLDFFEAETFMDDIVLDLGSEALSPQEKLQLVMARYGAKDPARADRLAADAAAFMLKAKRLTGVFTNFPDPEALATKRGCSVEPTAVADDDPDLGSDEVFLLNQDIWAAMRPRDQAGLLISVSAANELRAAGVFAPGRSRYLSALISSTVLGQQSLRQYSELLVSQLQLKTVSGAGIELQIDQQLRYFDDDHIESGYMADTGSTANVAGQEFHFGYRMKDQRWNDNVMAPVFDTEKKGFRVEFYPSGAVKTAFLGAPVLATVGARKIYFENSPSWRYDGEVPVPMAFHPDGKIKSGPTPAVLDATWYTRRFTINIHDQDTPLRELEFRPDGSLARASAFYYYENYLCEANAYEARQGRRWVCGKDKLSFDDEEYLLEDSSTKSVRRIMVGDKEVLLDHPAYQPNAPDTLRQGTVELALKDRVRPFIKGTEFIFAKRGNIVDWKDPDGITRVDWRGKDVLLARAKDFRDGAVWGIVMAPFQGIAVSTKVVLLPSGAVLTLGATDGIRESMTVLGKTVEIERQNFGPSFRRRSVLLLNDTAEWPMADGAPRVFAKNTELLLDAHGQVCEWSRYDRHFFRFAGRDVVLQNYTDLNAPTEWLSWLPEPNFGRLHDGIPFEGTLAESIDLPTGVGTTHSFSKGSRIRFNPDLTVQEVIRLW